MASIKELFTFSGRKFYMLFDEMAANLLSMSKIFVTATQDSEHLRSIHLKALEDLEHKNDDVAHNLFIELGRNFITPFDREDIYFLASSLDDVADYMYKAILELKNHHMGKADRTVQRVAKQHEAIVKLLAEAVNGLKNKRGLENLSASCYEMRKLIRNCDTMVDGSLSNLFMDYTDADVFEIIRRMDVYETLQKLLKKSKESVTAIESVIIKYA